MWKVNQENLTLHTPIFDVISVNKSSNTYTFNAIKLSCPNWVSAVIYNTDTKKFILNKEFRHGINDYCLEFPSGTVEENETPEQAILREVKEETGYNGEIVCKLFEGNPNTAFMDNTQTCFYVEVSGKKEERKLDKFEDIETVEIDDLFEIKDKLIGISQQLAFEKYRRLKEVLKTTWIPQV